MGAERNIIKALKANLTSASAALERSDWAALQALAEQEARLMDALRAMWEARRTDS